MDYSDSIEIGAPPDVVFALISDLKRMGEFSPENTGGEWLGKATGPRLGARFKGTNARDGDHWSTTAKITTYEPPSLFAFEVTWKRFAISRWEFRIEATPNGSRVTESWRDRRNPIIRKDGDSDGFVRAEYTKESIRTTLGRLKSACEAMH